MKIAENVQCQAGEERLLMKVSTSRFGEIEVAEEKIITMVTPVLGFPESHHFILRAHGEKSPFMWLQSLDNPDLAFVVIQPALIAPDYHPALPGAVKRELQLMDQEEPEILIILTIPKGRPQAMTANLLGPVVISASSRLAKQVLLDHTRYEACWPVFETPEASGL